MKSADIEDQPNVGMMLREIGEELLALAGTATTDTPPRHTRRLTRRPDDDALGRLAHRLYDDRRKRTRHIPSEFLGEPMWDILLDLYVCAKRNRLVSVTDACHASVAPATTTLRHIQTLTVAGFVERREDIHDRRRTWLMLTRKGEDSLTTYLREIA